MATLTAVVYELDEVLLRPDNPLCVYTSNDFHLREFIDGIDYRNEAWFTLEWKYGAPCTLTIHEQTLGLSKLGQKEYYRPKSDFNSLGLDLITGTDITIEYYSTCTSTTFLTRNL